MRIQNMWNKVWKVSMAVIVMFGTANIPILANDEPVATEEVTPLPPSFSGECGGASTGMSIFKKVDVSGSNIAGAQFRVMKLTLDGNGNIQYDTNGEPLYEGPIIYAISGQGGTVKLDGTVDDNPTKLPNDGVGYYFQEINAPDGFVIDASFYSVVGHNGASCRMTNYYQKLGIVVNKTSDVASIGDATLKDGIFALYDAPIDGNLLEYLEYRDDEVYGSGYFSSTTLTLGTKYYVEEVTAPTGFLKEVSDRIEVTASYGPATTNPFYFKPVDVVNKVITSNITIHKDRIDTKGNVTNFPGIHFSLSLDSDSSISYSGITDADGNLVFSNIPYGTYTLTEDVPAGYFNVEPQKIVIDEKSDAELTYTIKNTQIPPVLRLTFKIQKVLETSQFYTDADEKEVYAAIRFGLYSTTDFITPKDPTKVIKAGDLIQEFSLDENGLLSFDGLDTYPGEFYLVELTTHKDYVLSTDKITIIVEEDKETTITSTEFTNSLKKGSIEVFKVDELNNRLPDATFTLTKIDGDSRIEFGTAITNEEGTILFEDVPVGIYELEETVAPIGYNRDTKIETIEVTAEALEHRVSFVNLEQKGEIMINKYEMVDGKKTVLPGVTFELLQDGRIVKTGVTNVDGVIVFNNLALGTYTVHEVRPTGYVEITDQLVTLTYDVTKTTISSELEIENRKIRNSFILRKVDADALDAPLANVTFEIFDANDISLGKIKTDADGIARMDDLIVGPIIIKKYQHLLAML